MKKLLFLIIAISSVVVFSCKQERNEEIIPLVTVTNDKPVTCYCREIYVNSEVHNILPGSSLDLKKSYYDFWDGDITVPAYHLDKDVTISEILRGN